MTPVLLDTGCVVALLDRFDVGLVTCTPSFADKELPRRAAKPERLNNRRRVNT